VDCGRPVNPEGVRAQVESAAIYGLSATLHDAITIKGGRVEQSNFDDYQMPRMSETPKTEVHVVLSKEEPTGIGEPGLPVIAPRCATRSMRRRKSAFVVCPFAPKTWPDDAAIPLRVEAGLQPGLVVAGLQTRSFRFVAAALCRHFFPCSARLLSPG